MLLLLGGALFESENGWSLKHQSHCLNQLFDICCQVVEQLQGRGEAEARFCYTKITRSASVGNNLPHLLENLLVNEIMEEGPEIRTPVETAIIDLVFKGLFFQLSKVFFTRKIWKRFPWNTCMQLMNSFTVVLGNDCLNFLLTHSLSRKQIQWGREGAEVVW